MSARVRRYPILAAALAAALLATACSPSAGPAATLAPATPTMTVAPTPGEEAAAFAAFRSHVAAASSKLGKLMTTFSTDAGKGNVAAVKKDATAVRAWAKAEAAWLDAHPAVGCFASVYVLWDVVRQHADTVAADALAGQYEKAASDLDTLATVSTSAADRMAAAVCP
jgi:hypothetical protein